MSRYQKHFGIATFRADNLTLVLLIWLLLAAWFAPGHAAAAQVDEDNLFPTYYVTPLEGTSIELHTLVADFTVRDDAIAGLTATLDARYRLSNPAQEPVSVDVRIATPVNADTGALTLNADGQILALDPQADGSFTTVLTVPADGRLDLEMRVDAGLEGRRLPSFHYAARNLFGWPGRTSLRVSVTVPDRVAAESWLNVAPQEWSYSVAPSAEQTTIKWLYEADWPTTPFVFQFVHPDVWEEVRRADLAAGPGMAMESFLALGNLYASLCAESLADGATLGQAGERFYTQALAAYAAGVAEGETRGLPPSELAQLYAGMATLYRSRIALEDGQVDSRYAELMVRAAASAVAGLPPDNGRARELQHWRADGLRQMVAEARSRRDWAAVANLLEEMATLPPGLISPDVIAEEQRIATIQQALQLLEQGNRAAATALAGPELVAAALAPQTSLPLAAGWQVTVTIEPDGMVAEFGADVLPEGRERAQQAFSEQLARWESASLSETVSVQVDDAQGDDGLLRWHFTVRLPNREAALTLARSLPPSPDWALMRTVLQQIAPQWVDRSSLFRRSMQVTQQYDFSTVSAQWRDQATLLEQQAVEFETQRNALDITDVAGIEATLQASVQAANYRNAANMWQNLLESAVVITWMKLPDGFGTAERTWLTTLTAPVQLHTFQVNGPNPAGMLLILAGGVMFLLLASGMLWRLL